MHLFSLQNYRVIIQNALYWECESNLYYKINYETNEKRTTHVLTRVSLNKG